MGGGGWGVVRLGSDRKIDVVSGQTWRARHMDRGEGAESGRSVSSSRKCQHHTPGPGFRARLGDATPFSDKSAIRASARRLISSDTSLQLEIEDRGNIETARSTAFRFIVNGTTKASSVF